VQSDLSLLQGTVQENALASWAKRSRVTALEGTFDANALRAMMNGGETMTSWLRWRTLWNPAKGRCQSRVESHQCDFRAKAPCAHSEIEITNSVIAIALASGVFVRDGSGGAVDLGMTALSRI